MKRFSAMAVILSLAAMSVLQGCYGKMALTKKVYAVNGQVQDKFVRSLVTWVFIIVPVYAISALADFLLFNTIEFWSGHNPVSQGEKDFKFASGDDTYQVHATKSGDTVNYLINRFQGQQHMDALSITWDLKTGNSQASFSDSAVTREYFAAREKGGIVVTTRDLGNPGKLVVAQYQ